MDGFFSSLTLGNPNMVLDLEQPSSSPKRLATELFLAPEPGFLDELKIGVEAVAKSNAPKVGVSGISPDSRLVTSMPSKGRTASMSGAALMSLRMVFKKEVLELLGESLMSKIDFVLF